MSESMNQLADEQAAEAALGEMLAGGDDDAARVVEQRVENERELLTKHEVPAGWQQVRDEEEAALDLADVASGRRTTRKPVGEDDVQAYLAKYGGDTDAALRAAVHAQRLIGEKGSELGHLKKQLEGGQVPGGDEDSYDDLLYDDQPEPAFTPSEQFGSYQEYEDAVYTAMEENPEQAVHMAAASGNRELYEDAISSWFDEDPRAASRYERQVEYQQLAQRQQAVDTYNAVAQTQLAEAFENATSKLRDFSKYEAKMAEIAASPEGLSLMAGMTANTVGAKERVIRGLYALARGDASTSEEALSVDVPTLASGAIVPSGRNRRHNSMLDALNAEAEASNRVAEMFDQGRRQAGGKR